MKLIVGGASQGKLAFGLELLGRRETEGSDAEKQLAADGREAEERPEDVFVKPVVYGLHEYLRPFSREDDWEKAGEHMEQWLERLMRENPEAIVISNEVGCGIVPVSREDRLWRELCGRACRILAAEAEEVYRVSCGIPVKLKGKMEEGKESGDADRRGGRS